MKVLQLTNNYPTKKFPISGIFVKEQIDSLNNLGIENTVYLINGRENGKKEYLKQIFKLKRHLKQNKYDIIHCHHALSAITLFLSGYKNKNVVISFQNDPLNELGNRVFKWLQKKSNIQIFKNNSQYVNNQTGFYLFNGVNTNFFYPIEKELACKRLGIDQGKIYILFVSSNFIRKQKRYDRFKNVIKILREKYGYNNIEEIKLINTKRELIPYYFNATNVHLLSSDFEGSPNSVKECMACNTAVVSTDVGNVKELLNDVDGCFVSDSFDENVLAKLVNNALKQKCTKGREKLMKMNLDIESVAKKITNIYYKMVQ